MKDEIIHLHENSTSLNGRIKMLAEERTSFQQRVEDLQTDNSSLRVRIDELDQAVKNLNDSEIAIRNLVADLTIKGHSGTDLEMITQIGNLERLQAQTRSELKDIIDPLNTLELGVKQPPASGLFSYIDNLDHQSLFTEKVGEALQQEMTYAQIDDFLSTMLPPDLDEIIKDHPSLTKNYIRALRKV